MSPWLNEPREIPRHDDTLVGNGAFLPVDSSPHAVKHRSGNSRAYYLLNNGQATLASGDAVQPGGR